MSTRSFQIRIFRLADVIRHTDVSIKQESSYSSPYARSFDHHSDSPTAKRQRSTEPDGNQKRLKTDHGSIGNDDLAAIISQAAASVTQQLVQSDNVHGSQARNGEADTLTPREESSGKAISSGLLADPHLYMRILSLPILESLVRSCPSLHIGGSALRAEQS